MMNIFFIERAYDGTVGGSHTCLYNLVGSLDREKYKSCVGFYQENSYVEKFKGIGADVHLIDRRPVIKGNVLIRKIRNWHRLVHSHRKALSRIIRENRIELVVINNTISDSDDIIAVCCRLKVPVITFERGDMRYKPADINLSKKIYASIAISNFVKSNMENQRYSSDIRVIYDGVPMNCAERPSDIKRADIKKRIGIPEESIVIGIVGNIKEWKGQEFFIRAFMSLGERYQNMYGLVIGGCGVGDEGYLETLKRISGDSEVGKRLLFLGFRDDVQDLLDIMDVFVHASITPEPFGMVILEAMSHDVPVIATNFGGPVESLDHGSAGILVPPRDAEAIVEGVERYLRDREFRIETVERARRRVSEEFSLPKTIRQIEDLFREAVADSGRT